MSKNKDRFLHDDRVLPKNREYFKRDNSDKGYVDF